MVVFPGFEALDVFGPLQAFNMLANAVTMNLSIIASSLEPVSVRETDLNSIGSFFSQEIIPTHTYDNAPPLDLLIVPGGTGTTKVPNVAEAVSFVIERYPSLQYIMSVCTGAQILARSAILDGRSATTNKAFFNEVAAERPAVNWVADARWMVDGNIWTASGVSAGIDATLAFIEEVYGAETAKTITTNMEYNRETDSTLGPFADVWNLTSSYA